MGIYSAEDFWSDTPPPRIMGSETEYMLALEGNTFNIAQAVVMGVRVLYGGVDGEEFLSSNGGKVYPDCGCVEYATPEAAGPLQHTKQEMAGQRMVGEGTKRALGEAIPLYRRTGGRGAEDGGMLSVGYHQNLLTPQYERLGEQRHDAQVMGAYLATRSIWAGAGVLLKQRFGLSQKAHDINASGLGMDRHGFDGLLMQIGTYTNRTTRGQKPLLVWSRSGGGSMESHSPNWDRLEIRYADAAHSPWVRYMGMATASLTLRLLEHKDLFPKKVWRDLMLKDPGQSVRDIAADTNFNHSQETASGKHVTALQLQTQLAEMAVELSGLIHLPKDEHEAAYEWLRVCQDLKQVKYKDHDSLQLITDRVEWAARLFTIRRMNKRLGLTAINASNRSAAALDLLWDQIHPRSIADDFWRKQQADFYAKYSDEITALTADPPQQTRARVRAHALRRGATIPNSAWDLYRAPITQTVISIGDPYNNGVKPKS